MKAKSIIIVILAVLLAMSIFSHVLFFSLLGITNLKSLKRTMLANEQLGSVTVVPEDSAVDNSENNSKPSEIPSETPSKPTVDTPTPNASKVVFDKAGVKISVVAVEYDTFWESYELKLMIENNSNKNITITSSEEVVDGFMVDESIGFYCEVLAGKKAVSYLTLYNFDLEPLGITQPSVFEFKLAVTDTDDIFNTLATSDKIIVKVS